MTLVSVLPSPGNWVCFWYQMISQVHRDQGKDQPW